MGARERAVACLEALHAATQTQSKGAQRTRGDRRLVITEVPRLVYGGDGAPVGVEVRVELTAADAPVAIDPHRVIVNPPTGVVTAPEERDPDGNVTRPREVQIDPLAAFWDALWHSVDTYPSPETGRRP